MLCRNSRPFMPGSFRSVSTRSMEFSLSNLRPVSASPAESVVKPSSPRFNSSRRRIFASSSTIRMEGIAPVASFRLYSRNHQMRALSCRSAFVHRWKKYHEHGACAVSGTLNADRPVMPIHDLRNDRQTQAYSSLLRRHKWIKNLLPQFEWNTRPRVFNANLDSAGIAAVCRRLHHLHAQHSPARAHRVIRILHDVHEGLLAQALIQRHLRQISLVVLLHLNRCALP